MANRFKIYYDCGINIPELFLQFDNDVCVHLTNHSVAEVELEPGVHDLFAAYQMVVDNQTMDFEKRITAVVEEGFDYTLCLTDSRCPHRNICSRSQLRSVLIEDGIIG